MANLFDSLKSDRYVFYWLPVLLVVSCQPWHLEFHAAFLSQAALAIAVGFSYLVPDLVKGSRSMLKEVTMVCWIVHNLSLVGAFVWSINDYDIYAMATAPSLFLLGRILGQSDWNSCKIKLVLEQALVCVIVLCTQEHSRSNRMILICGCTVSIYSYCVAKLLQDAAKTQGPDLVASVAHDLRTPMQIIHNGLELIEAHSKDVEIVADLKSALDLMGVLCRNLMVASRHKALSKNNSTFSLSEVLERTENVMGRYGKGNRTVQIEYHLSDKLNDFVLSDLSTVWGGLINFLTNAKKYTSEGKIVVYVDLHGDHIRFAVADTGVGVPPKTAHNLFLQPYCQLQSSTDGVGIGLYSVAANVQGLGGKVYYASLHNFCRDNPEFQALDPGTYSSGSVFVMSVPYVPVDVPVEKDVTDTTTTQSMQDEKKRRILIVDDDFIVRKLLRKVIEREGLQVAEASNGAEGLQLMKNEVFTLVFLDVVMPCMDGYECVRQLREYERSRGTEESQFVCGLSGNSHNTKEAVAAGMDVLVAKPMGVELVRQVLKASQLRSKNPSLSLFT